MTTMLPPPPMQRVILHSLPTDLLRKGPGAVFVFLVICMCCVLCCLRLNQQHTAHTSPNGGGGGGAEAKEKFACLQSASNFRPLLINVISPHEIVWGGGGLR